MKTKNYLFITGSVLVLIIISYHFILKCIELNFIQDDAYTSFRYAKNFINGNGLVFNKGEQVEGFTNFLWVILLSKLYFFNADLEITSQILSTFFGLAVIWITYLLSRLFLIKDNASFIDHSLTLLPPFLVSYSAPMIYWSVSGMETSLFIFLTLLSLYYFFTKESRQKFGKVFIIVSIINSLLRPEGLFFFIIICLYELFSTIINENFKFRISLKKYFNNSRNREFLYFFIPIILFIVFRLIYYGHYFPNTFYAKTEFTIQFLVRGWEYFYEFAESNLLFGGLLIFPIFAFNEKKNEISFFYFFALLNFIAIIIIGGDVLPIYRFFLPFLPLIFIFSLKGIISITEYMIVRFKIIRTISLIVLILIISFYAVTNYHNQLPKILEKKSYESGLVKKMKIYADWVESFGFDKKEKITVALSTIGSFSFNTNARVIDIVGLTNEYIAHNPKEIKGIDEELPVLWKERHYNADYVLNEKPDYIIFPAGAKPSAFAECAIFSNKEFQKNYYVALIFSSELQQLLPIFAKREKPIVNFHNECNIKFLKHFINASNIINGINNMSSYNLLDVINECDKLEKLCKTTLPDVNTLRGLAHFQFNKINESKNYFEKSLALDSLNMVSHFYLMKIYNHEMNEEKTAGHYKFLAKYSPGVFNY